jgi:hypothetical protein
MGLSSPLFKFIELIYSYTDRDNKPVSGRLTAKDAASFNIKNLKQNDSTVVTLNCRIVPVAESGLILDTLPMIREFTTKTATDQEYVSARDVRPIVSALIDNNNTTQATITFGPKTDHLVYTDIRYIREADGQYVTHRVENSQSTLLCSDIKRGTAVQIRGTYTPPETDIIITGSWSTYGPFSIKYDRKDWVVIPRSGSIEYDWVDGRGSQNLWRGGHPMLVLDNDPVSGWHSIDAQREIYAPLPQVLLIDMKETRPVSRVITNGSYWKTVQVFLTDDPDIAGYSTYTVDWDDSNREGEYNSWVSSYYSRIPATVPTSWGTPIAQGVSEPSHIFELPSVPEGRFLIIRFPDNTDWKPDYPSTYINVVNVEVYGI